MKYKGAYVALITPFKDDLSVDYDKLEELVEFQIRNNIDGIVPCGTTGETPTLSDEEYVKVIKTVIDKVNKRVKVVAGAGANSTEKAVKLTKICKELGADAVLSTCPYYNKPTQKGIIEHYKQVASVGIDVFLYNIPSRTGVNIEASTVKILSEIENIVAIKEASGNIDQMIQIKNLCQDKLDIFSGEDNLILPMYAIGCHGVISVIANIVPNEVSKFYNTNTEKQYKIHEYLYDISKNMFIEGNPVTIKAAMEIMNLCKSNLRLPLYRAEQSTFNRLNNLLKEKGLL